jgi:hypothetical protein
MHYLLKHKILQFVFKCLNVHFSAPTCFGSLGPSSGSIHQNLAKVTKIPVFLKYQLKHLVKIVVVWCIKISACGVCSGCCVACVTHMFEAFTWIKVSTVNLFVAVFCTHEDGYRRMWGIYAM